MAGTGSRAVTAEAAAAQRVVEQGILLGQGDDARGLLIIGEAGDLLIGSDDLAHVKAGTLQDIAASGAFATMGAGELTIQPSAEDIQLLGPGFRQIRFLFLCQTHRLHRILSATLPAPPGRFAHHTGAVNLKERILDRIT